MKKFVVATANVSEGTMRIVFVDARNDLDALMRIHGDALDTTFIDEKDDAISYLFDAVEWIVDVKELP